VHGISCSELSFEYWIRRPFVDLACLLVPYHLSGASGMMQLHALFQAGMKKPFAETEGIDLSRAVIFAEDVEGIALPLCEPCRATTKRL
jgi:hypothetical protein